MDTTKHKNFEEVQEEELRGDEDTKSTLEHDECEAKLSSVESAYKRAIADYQNLEKRVREERLELMKFANKELLLRFLTILDTLLLAQQHENSDTLRVVTAQFTDILKAEGVIKLETTEQKFDPQTMEVVSTAEGKEGFVIQEVRAGYLLHDKLLRPAQVLVGQGEKK